MTRTPLSTWPTILGVALCAAAGPAGAANLGADEIERIEDLTEDLANSLHDLSFTILERDLDAFARFFADDATGTDIPVAPGPPVPTLRWIEERPVREPRSGLSRDELIDVWGDHLAGYESVEDVRIKVKHADVTDGDPVRADADIKFFWLGRDLEGHREWVKGTGRVSAERIEEGRWALHRFEITELHPKLSRVDLFSEVSLPAGTAHSVPAWGEPGHEVFIAHGVATADVDLDGFLDVFVSGNFQNFLYRNRGDGTFENRAEEALVAVTPLATAPLFLDYDADGDPDLFLASLGPQMLFENRWIPDGQLIFDEVAEPAGVAHRAEGYSALASDVNLDGHPDIYVCSYNKYGEVLPNSWSDATNGTPNLLFLNRGDGTFEEAAQEWGCSDSRWTYAGHFGDLSGDGRPDLYLANDFGKNSFLVNDGDHFRHAAGEFGLHDTGNGMGVSLGDYNNDGRLDVHVTNMSSTAGNRIIRMVFPELEGSPEHARIMKKIAAGNTLFENTGGHFEDVSEKLGPFSSGWAFGGGFVDFDNDGWEDLHSPNGFISGKGLKDT
jgi:hypothetical protein